MPDMKKVIVVYTGPGAEGDAREMKVSESEAEALIARGNWSKKKSRAPKKEVSNNA